MAAKATQMQSNTVYLKSCSSKWEVNTKYSTVHAAMHEFTTRVGRINCAQMKIVGTWEAHRNIYIELLPEMVSNRSVKKNYAALCHCFHRG